MFGGTGIGTVLAVFGGTGIGVVFAVFGRTGIGAVLAVLDVKGIGVLPAVTLTLVPTITQILHVHACAIMGGSDGTLCCKVGMLVTGRVEQDFRWLCRTDCVLEDTAEVVL